MEPPSEEKKNNRCGCHFLKVAGISIAVSITVSVFLMILLAFVLPDDDGYVATDTDVQKERNCNVRGIELRGDLVTYIVPSQGGASDESGGSSEDQTSSEDIVSAINDAEKDSAIKAILLEVDSYGGYPVAGEEVANALRRARKPTVALIRGAGDSAAYMAASGADRIFASANSDVGSIGITMSYLENVEKNKNEGLSYVLLSAGKYKDTGDPDKPLSDDEKKLLMRDVNILHQNFISLVAKNRNLDIEKVKKLSDGSTMLGALALKNGLIDQIGGSFEAENYLKQKIGAQAEVCW